MDFSLIETFGWTPQNGFIRLDQHLNRLTASAASFEIPFVRQQAIAALQTLDHEETPQRVRMELFRDGRLDLQSHQFQPLPPDQIYRIAIAETQLNSADSLLRHKTNQRSAYSAARQEYSAEKIDEVLLKNERGEICEGTIMNVFVRRHANAPLLTPPLECGLLAGILRADALDNNIAETEILTVDDLLNAHEIYVGNSLRGFIRSKLVDHQSPATA